MGDPHTLVAQHLQHRRVGAGAVHVQPLQVGCLQQYAEEGPAAPAQPQVVAERGDVDALDLLRLETPAFGKADVHEAGC